LGTGQEVGIVENDNNSIRRLFEPKKLQAQQVFAAAVASMLALHLFEPGIQILENPWNWFGAVPAAAGLLLNMWAIGALEIHQTTSGLGVNTWADRMFKHYRTTDRSISDITTLVTAGPYKYSRHPMYLGMVLAVLGLGILLGSAIPIFVVVVFPLILDQRYIGTEEATLEEMFGEAFQNYTKRVRRWI
jgi:protein-S-isoprenylcysteine O-methyltransferase Ste14